MNTVIAPAALGPLLLPDHHHLSPALPLVGIGLPSQTLTLFNGTWGPSLINIRHWAPTANSDSYKASNTATIHATLAMLNYADSILKKNPTWGTTSPSSQESVSNEAMDGAAVAVKEEKLEVEVKRVENLTEEQILKVTDVLVKAFAGDPFGAILVGGNTSLSPIQLRVTVAAANIGGTIHVATLPSSEAGEEDKIVGVAVWFAPGQSLNSTVEQRSAGWDAFMDVVDDETRRWWLEYFIPLMSITTTTAFGEGVVLRAWDLHLFGVLPEYQGRGVAGALMAYASTLAKETGAPMVLETQKEENVTIYSKLGFKVQGETLVESRVGKSRFWLLGKGF